MLKTKTITTDKATLLVVEMPEGVNEYHHSRAGVSLSQGDGSYLFISGNWQILGRLPDITEEQASEVVEYKNITSDYQCHCCGYDVDCYRNYLEQSEKDWGENPVADRLSDSIDSLYSLLQAKEVYFENPYKDPGLIPSYELDVYREAQSKVWDKERTYLFIKVD